MDSALSINKPHTRDIVENFKEYNKGRPIKCKTCGHEFKMLIPEKREQWKESHYLCPSCSTTYCFKSKTERTLLDLQDEYLSNGRDVKILDKMYKILFGYVEALAKTFFSKAIIEKDRLEYYQHTATTLLIEKYLEDQTFKIDLSFSGYLIFKIKQSLWHKSEQIHDGEKVETLDVLYAVVHDPRNNKEDANIVLIDNEDKTSDLVRKLGMIVRDNAGSRTQFIDYMRLVNLYLHLEYGERSVTRVNNAFFPKDDNGVRKYGQVGRREYQITLSRMKEEVHNSSLKNHDDAPPIVDEKINKILKPVLINRKA